MDFPFLNMLIGALLGLCATLVVCRYTPHPLAPIHAMNSPHRVPNEYIIALEPDHPIDDHWRTIGINLSSFPQFSHYRILGGYTVEINDHSILAAVRKDQNVKFVEAERKLHPKVHGKNTLNDSLVTHHSWDDFPMTHHSKSHSKRQAPGAASFHFRSLIEHQAPYNLQMIGAGVKLRPPPEDLEGEYQMLYPAGKGVDLYIMDSGIEINHPGFQGRATNFQNRAPDDTSLWAPQPAVMKDFTGHGTAVAGLAGGSGCGVAQEVNLINVKVLNDEDPDKLSFKLLIKAVDDIAARHAESCRNNTEGRFRGSVVNMSFGGDLHESERIEDDKGAESVYGFDWAIGKASRTGVNFIASADNKFGQLTRDDFPCIFKDVICVGYVDSKYQAGKVSSGPEIDFWAPGKNVTTFSIILKPGLWMANETGCSFAAPQVAGVAAIFTSWLGLASGGVKTYLYWNSLAGVVLQRPGVTISNNYFATTGIRKPLKNHDEPFKYAGAVPAATIQLGVEYPLDDWKKVPWLARRPKPADKVKPAKAGPSEPEC